MPSGRRPVEQWFNHNFSLVWYRRRRDSPGSLALDLKRDLVEAGGAQDIQQMNDIAMDRAAIAAKKHLRFGVFLIDLLQARKHFIPAHLLFAEAVGPVFITAAADVLAL